MNYTVRWTERAADRMEEAFDYLEGVREGTGEKFKSKVLKMLEDIERLPYSNPNIDTFPVEYRKAIVSNYDYWIVYKVTEDTIFIVTVWHAIMAPDSWQDDLASSP